MFNYPRLSSLTYLGFEINAAIDAGHGDQFSFQEIYQALERRSLLEDLSNKLAGVIDLGSILMQKEQHLGLINVLTEASEAFRGRERRKVGVERSGLTLLMAIILEAIQQQNWTTPDLKPLSPKEVASVLGPRGGRLSSRCDPLAFSMWYRWDGNCSKN